MSGKRELDKFNARILHNWGRDIYGRQYYRVVNSEDQFEERLGTFEDYQGEIYLRTVTEVRTVPKYQFDKPYDVMEKLFYNDANPELKANFSYEPIWVFKHPKTDDLLPIEWWAIECLVKMDRAVKKLKLNESDIYAIEEIKLAREKMRYKLMLQDESPIISTMVHNGAGIFVPSNYAKG